MIKRVKDKYLSSKIGELEWVETGMDNFFQLLMSYEILTFTEVNFKGVGPNEFLKFSLFILYLQTLYSIQSPFRLRIVEN
jgi:hypothetical protein